LEREAANSSEKKVERFIAIDETRIKVNDNNMGFTQL
jgi:transposase-like protein